MNLKNFISKYGGWSLIVIFSLLPVVRWFIIKDPSVIFTNWFMFATTIAKIGALVGTVLYALNFVLALRASWLEDLFGGMNRVYIAHHITGGLALIALLLHPLFLSLRYIQDFSQSSFRNAADILLPDKVVLNSGLEKFLESAASNFGSIAFFGLVVLLLFTFFYKLPYAIWLKTHRLLGVAFLIAGLHIVYISSDVKYDLPLRLYIIVWVGIGLAAFVHRSLLPNIFVHRYKYVVTDVQKPKNNVTSITLAPLGKHIPFKAGQFVFISFLKSGIVSNEMHPFSLTSKEGSDNLEVQVKYLGDYTTKLSSLQIGSKAKIEGAFGRFSPNRYRDTDQVWIAGGIGITPFISAIRSAKPDMAPTWLFYSVVDRAELLSTHEFSVIAGNTPQFMYEPYVASEQTGFLSVDYIKSKIQTLEGKTFFLCGPPAMMQSLKQQLKNAGVPSSKIISEEFSIS